MPPLLSPTANFTVCTASALPLGIGSYATIALEVEAAGLDLDLTTWIGRRRYRPGNVFSTVAASCIRSLWLSASDESGWHSIPVEDSRTVPTPLNVIVRLPATTFDDDLLTVRNARERWRERPWIDGVTIVLPATAHDGRGLHLIRVRTLRRYLEEWDLNFGFDVCGLTDTTWEAEAAILLAGERLTTIRLAAPLHRVANRSTDVLNRTLATLAETRFQGSLSIAPTLPFWLSWHRPSIVRDLEANRDAASHIFLERSLAMREPFESHFM